MGGVAGIVYGGGMMMDIMSGAGDARSFSSCDAMMHASLFVVGSASNVGVVM